MANEDGGGIWIAYDKLDGIIAEEGAIFSGNKAFLSPPVQPGDYFTLKHIIMKKDAINI